MANTPHSFICATCGQSHSGLPTDTAYTLPDVVWAIPEEERANRAKWTTDLCQMGESYFIRCILQIPFTDEAGHYGWGAWASVEWTTFKKYLDLYEMDGSGEPRAAGLLANELPTYGATLGLTVQLQFQSKTARPTLHFDAGAAHPLAIEAANGMSYARYHEILMATGQIEIGES